MESENMLLLPSVEEENACLPLPVNVVSQYWNVSIPLSEAAERSRRYPDSAGSIIMEGIELAEKYGLSCKIVNSTLSGLKKIINIGIPPIVILPGIPEITQHASVLSGYDDAERTIIHYIQKNTRQGEQQEGAIPQDIFEKEWSEDGRTAIILAPQDVISSVDVTESDAESNRLCFVSERLHIRGDSAGIDSLKKALKLNPENTVALQMLGALLNERGSDECVKYYEDCIALNQRHYLAHSGLGNYHLKSGEFETAESFYTKAIQINPKRSARIYKNRAYLRAKQRKNSQARDDLKEYLKLSPDARDRGVVEQAIREL